MFIFYSKKDLRKAYERGWNEGLDAFRSNVVSICKTKKLKKETDEGLGMMINIMRL